MTEATVDRIKDTTSVESETLDSVLDHWQTGVRGIDWNCIFVLPMGKVDKCYARLIASKVA